MGLNDKKYSTLRGQILAMEPLPTLERIFNIVRQEEHHKKMMNDREEQSEGAVAFAVAFPVAEKPICQWKVRA